MYLTVSMRLTILAVTSRSAVERLHMIRLTEIEGEILRAASGDVASEPFFFLVAPDSAPNYPA